MKPFAIVLLVLLLSGIPPFHPLVAGDRAALVIGNDAYPPIRNADGKVVADVSLSNCINDASAVRDMLRDQLGFAEAKIIYGENLTRTGMFEKLEEFKKTALDADLALVFYAGHGMESLDGRENFLIPVDADLIGARNSEALLRGTSVNLKDILEQTERATAGPKVILLDCCRDRPAKRSLLGASAEGGGLAQIPEEDFPADTLILLAAAPNRQADDGERHGPFTEALLSHLPVGGQNILDAFFQVSDTVRESTGARQVPWLKFDGSGSLFRKNALVPEGTDEGTLDSGTIGDGLLYPVGEGQGIIVRYVPGGDFVMGSPKSESGRDKSERAVNVTLSRHFWMGETEVTQAMWQAVMGTTVQEMASEAGRKGKVRGLGPDHPMVFVSYTDATLFVLKMNELGLLEEGWEWSLPTEAQWERACRGGTESPFAFGESLSSTEANFDGNFPYGGAAEGPYLERTTPVMSYSPNAYGLYDLHGNVWEWCFDWYGEALPGGVDPWGPPEGEPCVMRGGSFRSIGNILRSAYRDYGNYLDQFEDLGLRLVITKSEE